MDSKSSSIAVPFILTTPEAATTTGTARYVAYVPQSDVLRLEKILLSEAWELIECCWILHQFAFDFKTCRIAPSGPKFGEPTCSCVPLLVVSWVRQCSPETTDSVDTVSGF